MTKPYFYFIPFQGYIECGSRDGGSFITNDMSKVVYNAAGFPISVKDINRFYGNNIAYKLTFDDFVSQFICKSEDTGDKTNKHIMMRFESDVFPLKDEQHDMSVEMDRWNGTIFVDLDFNPDKSEFVRSFDLNAERYQAIYQRVQDIVIGRMRDNFLYIEHSASRRGIHILFYFDVPKTFEYFRACGDYVKNMILTYASETHIGNTTLDALLRDKDVFDPVYKRPYQKCYLTGYDYILNPSYSGFIKDSIINDYLHGDDSNVLSNVSEVRELKIGSYELKDLPESTARFNADYMTRLKVATALKACTRDETEWMIHWIEFCKHLDFSKRTKTKSAEAAIRQMRYSSLDVKTAQLWILDRFGFKIDKQCVYYNLQENEYMYDVIGDVLKRAKSGINLLIAPTGTGKTETWKRYYRELLSDRFLTLNESPEKPILVIEPMNSIIETKYTDVDYNAVCGRNNFSDYDLDNLGFFLSSYNKICKREETKSYTVRPDIRELLGKFRLIVIDESHKLSTDKYRYSVILPFIKSISCVTDTPVLLQTATPVAESELFHIENTFKIIKKKDIHISYRYMATRQPFNLTDLYQMIKNYTDCGRKVYIYKQTLSDIEVKAFYWVFRDYFRIGVFHKKIQQQGEREMLEVPGYLQKTMKDITSDQVLENTGHDYNVFLSSIYFGVGNDLNDCGKAAIIIIGNNIPQEDIQVIGRFRKSKDIEVSVILSRDEYDKYTAEYGARDERVDFQKNISESIVESDDYDSFDIQGMINRNFQENMEIVNAKRIRDKSYITEKKKEVLKDREDADIDAISNAYLSYYRNFIIKERYLEQNGIDVIRDVEVMDNTVRNRFYTGFENYIKQADDIHDDMRHKIVFGKVDEKDLTEDKDLEFYYFWKRCLEYKIHEVLEIDEICDRKNEKYIRNAMEFRDRFTERTVDGVEIYALNECRKCIREMDADEKKGTVRREYQGQNIEISNIDDKIVKYYSRFINWKERGNKDPQVQANLFKEFVKLSTLWADMPDRLFGYMFERFTFEGMEGLDEFMSMADFDASDSDGLRYTYYRTINVLVQSRKRGRVQGEKVNDHKQYKTKRVMFGGQVYESREDAAAKLGVSMATVKRMLKDGRGEYV